MLDDAILTTRELEGGTPVVVARGEIDMRLVPRLHKRLTEAVDASVGGDLVVDLTDATFIDSAALGVLVGAARRLSHLGGRLVVIVQHPHILRVLELTGLGRVFGVVETREAALAAL